MLANLFDAGRRLFYGADLLRLRPFGLSPEATDDSNLSALWVPATTMGRRVLHALDAPVGSTITFRAYPPRGSVVRSFCRVGSTVLPLPYPVEFEMVVEAPALAWRGATTATSGTNRTGESPAALSLSLPLPPEPLGEVLIHLTARPAGGPLPPMARVLWGEPRIESRRPFRDIRRSLVGLIARFQRTGLVGALRYYSASSAADEHRERYRRWVAAHALHPDALDALRDSAMRLPWRPRISLLVTAEQTDAAGLHACLTSLRQQVYPNWEVCIADHIVTAGVVREVWPERSRGRIRIIPGSRPRESASLDDLFRRSSGEFVAHLTATDVLSPDALHETVDLLNRFPSTDLVYSDEDEVDESGDRVNPVFKPDWSPEHLLSTHYLGQLTVVRSSVVHAAGGYRAGFATAQDYDLALRVTERTAHVAHIPKVLCHRRSAETDAALASPANSSDDRCRALQEHVDRLGVAATVETGAAPGLYRVRHAILGAPLVSIIIPTRGDASASSPVPSHLYRCLRSIVEKTTYRHVEIVIAEDVPLAPATAALLEGVPHQRVTYPVSGPFNFSRKVNWAVGASRGSQVLILNDDVEVVSEEWVEAMLEWSQQEAIGAVGAKLLYPDGRLQHVGVLLGVCGLAAHAYHSAPGSTPGHAHSAVIVRNYSAVTAACLMTRRALFDRLQGFDEQFARDFNDTDYCLRLGQAGFRTVYTPYAVLYHLESASFGARRVDGREAEAMRRKWPGVCHHDPYFNPNFSREFPDYRVQV